MTTTAPAPPSTPSRYRGIRKFLLGVLFVGFLLFGWYFLRGTWATANPTDPTPEQGVVSRLVLTPEGDKEIRTAVVIPVPIDTAWKILSNYEEWEKLFKTVRKNKEVTAVDDNHHHVVSDVMTPLGMITLDFVVKHEKTADGYVASWDAPTAELPTNRGKITLTAQGKDRTLLVYNVRKQYRRYPQFVVNNMLRGSQRDLVHTLSKRMIEIAKEK